MKKFTKKLLTTLIALAITLGFASTAVFAEGNQTAGNQTTSETTKGTAVETSVSQSFTWEIPESLDMGTADTKNLVVEVTSNTIAFGKQLTITYKGANDDENGNHRLKDAANEGNFLAYTITGHVADQAGTALIVLAGTATGTNTLKVNIDAANKKFAGSYTDTITFTAKVEDQPKAPATNE